MANIASVAKRARQAEKRKERNSAYRSQIRTAKKRVAKLIAAGSREELVAYAPSAIRLMDKMVTRGIIHRNNAARNKSRMIKNIRVLVPEFALAESK